MKPIQMLRSLHRLPATRLFSVSILFGSMLAAAPLLAGVETTIVIPGDGNSSQCEPLTGCNNVDRYMQVYPASQFTRLSGSEEIKLTGMAFRPVGDWSTVDFGNVEINLDVVSTTVLDPVFENNYSTDGPTTVFTGALTLQAVPDPDGGPDLVEIKFNAGLCDIPDSTDKCFVYDPIDDNGNPRHLLFEFRNLFGDGRGRPTQFLEAEDDGPDNADSISSAYFLGNRNSPNVVYADATTANVLSSQGLVTKFQIVIDNPTSISGISPFGQNIVNIPGLFKKLSGGNVFVSPDGGNTDLFACLFRDERDEFDSTGALVSSFSQYLPWNEIRPEDRVAGSCDFLDLLANVRFEPEHRFYPGVYNGTFGAYGVIISSDAQGITFEGPLTVTTDLNRNITEIFPGFDFVDPDFFIAQPGEAHPESCSSEDLSQREQIFAPGTTQNGRTTMGQCNRSLSIVRGTPLAFLGRFDLTANEERFTIEQYINELTAIKNDAGTCVDVDALPVIALIEDELAALHNDFVQGRYNGARGHAEEIALLSDLGYPDGTGQRVEHHFSGCATESNFQGLVTSQAMTLAFLLFDRWELAASAWQCYAPPPQLVAAGRLPGYSTECVRIPTAVDPLNGQ